MRSLLFSSRVMRACVWGDRGGVGAGSLREHKDTQSPGASFSKTDGPFWSCCLQMDQLPQLGPFLGAGGNAWTGAVMWGSWSYSFLRSSYITDELCNRAVGGSRKLARTLDKRLNYSRGRLESGRLGDSEEWVGPPADRTQPWSREVPSPQATGAPHFLSICIWWALETSCFPTEGLLLPLGKVKNMTHLQQRHKIAVW